MLRRRVFPPGLGEGISPQSGPHPQGDRPAGTPSVYRPICLLDEVGKLLERVIVGRLVRHLGEVGPNLHEEQFGFREGRSTTDAILRVQSFVDSVTEGGGVLIVVSLDIVNAFNIPPWGRIMDAMEYHRVPGYLVEVEIIRSYFENRGLGYRDKSGTHCLREVHCGVP